MMFLRAAALPLRWFYALTVLAASAWAASSTAWEMTTWQDFQRGKFSSVSLTRDGRLTLAPAVSTLYSDGQSVVWSAAQAADGTIYFGTGHKGSVVKLDPAGKTSILWSAPEPEVFAVAVDARGAVYAATSPDGKVYKIENGKASEYFNPKEKYIWSLAISPKSGTVFVGTGENGKIYQVTAPGQGEVYFDSGQAHITALLLEWSGSLLAGSDPNGILYRISGKDKGFVVYDSPLPEIRTIAYGSGGLYVAALGGSVAKRTAATPTAGTGTGVMVTAPTTTITVEAQAGVDIKPKADAPKPQPAPPVPQTAPPVEISGIEKSAIYRIAADGSVETLWSSKDENAYDLAVNTSGLYFATDGSGRIYEVSDNRKVRLIDQTDSDVMRLVKLGMSGTSRIVAATATQGKVLEIGTAPAPQGEYESPVHDTGSLSRWGRLEWHGTGKLAFRTRSGNSARPDKTWSDWSTPISDPSGVKSPNARFVQWKAELGPGADIDSVSLAYRPQNNAPAVRNITVVSQLATQAQAARPQTPAGAAYSITVTDTGDSGASTLSGTSTQNAGRPGARQLVISWTADDTDGDTLSYTLSFRGEDEREWKNLRTNLADTTYTIDGDALADGRYFFRVIASDRLSNPPSDARDGELESSPVRIDNTPPLVTLTREGEDVIARAVDQTSPLRRCEMSIDARPWVVVESEDGVTDSREEVFRMRLQNLSGSEHVVTVRVTDAAGNPGLAKLVVR